MKIDFSGGKRQVLRPMKSNLTPIILISTAGFAVTILSHASLNKCSQMAPCSLHQPFILKVVEGEVTGNICWKHSDVTVHSWGFVSRCWCRCVPHKQAWVTGFKGDLPKQMWLITISAAYAIATNSCSSRPTRTSGTCNRGFFTGEVERGKMLQPLMQMWLHQAHQLLYGVPCSMAI